MSECMDNFRVHVVGHEQETLQLALELAGRRHGTVTHWMDAGDGWACFYWHEPGATGYATAHKLPTATRPKDLTRTITAWLKKNPPREEEPDLDGSCSHGFELDTEPGNHAWSYETFRIRSIWAEHHK